MCHLLSSVLLFFCWLKWEIYMWQEQVIINYNKLHADPKQGKNLDISTLCLHIVFSWCILQSVWCIEACVVAISCCLSHWPWVGLDFRLFVALKLFNQFCQKTNTQTTNMMPFRVPKLGLIWQRGWSVQTPKMTQFGCVCSFCILCYMPRSHCTSYLDQWRLKMCHSVQVCAFCGSERCWTKLGVKPSKTKTLAWVGL